MQNDDGSQLRLGPDRMAYKERIPDSQSTYATVRDYEHIVQDFWNAFTPGIFVTQEVVLEALWPLEDGRPQDFIEGRILRFGRDEAARWARLRRRRAQVRISGVRAGSRSSCASSRSSAIPKLLFRAHEPGPATGAVAGAGGERVRAGAFSRARGELRAVADRGHLTLCTVPLLRQHACGALQLQNHVRWRPHA